MADINQILFQSQARASKVYNVNTNHPLIQNEQQYLVYKKYVSIHSEDRNVLRFPNSNEFEIELPEDLLNVLTIRLTNWTFPSNYNTFSLSNSNVIMTFKINNPYNPGTHAFFSPLYSEIFKCLLLSANEDFIIMIETGFYNPQQMVTELTNKFNYAVTQRIIKYLTDTTNPNYNPTTFPGFLSDFQAAGGYNNFIIVYNNVGQKIWFGNNSDGFILTNSNLIKPLPHQTNANTAPNLTSINIDNMLNNNNNTFCNNHQLPDFSNWGLPGFLGLTKCDTESVSGTSITNTTNIPTINGVLSPRFYYGDVFPGDNGYWLLPNPTLPNSEVFWIESPFKINLMGPSFIYLEMDGYNCIDETSPYNLSKFTFTTNETNGIVNSAFAKLAIPTTPISQWFDRDSLPYKEFMPPAERIRKLKFKARYHNGQLCDFNSFDFSLMLEFVLLQPQQARKWNPILGSSSTKP